MARAVISAKFVRSANCPNGKKKIDYFDLKQTGFMLEVRSSGGKTFYQRYIDERGREHQYKIAAADRINLSAARRRARKIVSEALIGEDPCARRKALRSIPTFVELAVGRYLPFVKSYKRSWKTDETLLRRHILPALESKFADQVKIEDVIGLVQRMRAQGYSTGTTNRVVIEIRHIYNLAQKWNVPGIVFNPTTGIPLAPDVNRGRYLNVEEAERLIASINADQNRVAANAILLLLLTGARRNEITQAKWENVDWNNKCLLVPLSKSGKPRRIALMASAIEVLKSLNPDPDNPYIFPSPTTRRPCPSLHFPWSRIRAHAGLPDLRLHDLRHSFASFAVNNGESLHVVQGLLGHANSWYTQRYSHLMPETLLRAVEGVGEVLNRGRPSPVLGETNQNELATSHDTALFWTSMSPGHLQQT